MLTSNNLPLTTFPLSIDSFVFKILPKNQILLMIKADSNRQKILNYLNIGAFEKSDTGYYIDIESLSCNRYGGGGGIGIYISKEKIH